MTSRKPATLKGLAAIGVLSAILLISSSAAFFLAGTASAQDTRDALLEAVRSGQAIAIMRHAIAPGTGDPSDFDVDDCATQRNLSQEGRDQARAIGAVFREFGVSDADIRSSAWCRCKDTAELLDIGEFEIFPPLNSFFQARERQADQMRELRGFLSDWKFEGRPLVMVTHQVVISALTGFYPRSGETVIFTQDNEGNPKVLGSFLP